MKTGGRKTESDGRASGRSGSSPDGKTDTADSVSEEREVPAAGGEDTLQQKKSAFRIKMRDTTMVYPGSEDANGQNSHAGSLSAGRSRCRTKKSNDMFRERLSAALEAAVRKTGYAFYRGFEYRLNEKPLRFPAVWCVPPKMIRIDGREEGEATSRVTLHLMEKNLRYDETLKERAWDRMEQDALRIIRRTEPCDGIFCAENIVLTPAEFSLTVHGELSIKAEFDVRTDFGSDEKTERL